MYFDVYYPNYIFYNASKMKSSDYNFRIEEVSHEMTKTACSSIKGGLTPCFEENQGCFALGEGLRVDRRTKTFLGKRAHSFTIYLFT